MSCSCPTALPAQARDFEQAGLPRTSAERLAEQITELIVINRVKMEETFVTNAYMEKVRPVWGMCARVVHAFLCEAVRTARGLVLM